MATHLPPNWKERLLALLAAKINTENQRLLEAWARVEGGDAVENPLNTTYGLAGSTSYNDAGVRNFRSTSDPRPVEGISATAITLTAKDRMPDGTLKLRYGGILADFQSGTKTAEQIVNDRQADFLKWSGSDYGYIELLIALLREV